MQTIKKLTSYKMNHILYTQTDLQSTTESTPSALYGHTLNYESKSYLKLIINLMILSVYRRMTGSSTNIDL